MSEPDERSLRRRAEDLASLVRLPAFMTLHEEAQKRRERDQAQLLGLMESDMAASALQRQADFYRGFSAGMRYVTHSMPRGAVRRLQKSDVREPESSDVDYWEVSRG